MIRMRLTILYLLSIIAGCQRAPIDEYVYMPVNDKSSVPVVSYYVDRHIETPELVGVKTSVIISIWENGTIIWSENNLGGEPYYRAILGADAVTAILEYFDEQCRRERSLCKVQHAAIHDDVPTLVVLNGKTSIYMKNSHVLWEAESNEMVGTGSGVRSLALQDPNSIKQLRTEEYLLFRSTWDEMILFLKTRVPNKGERVDVVFQEDKIKI